MAIQFKYGNTWQHKYRIGDQLKWGGNDKGSPEYRRVLVAGIAGPCPVCGADYLEFEVLIENGVLVAVSKASEASVCDNEDGFIVLE